MDISSTTTLNNGIEMPLVGLGTYQLADAHVGEAVDWALEAGYRAIDTASLYGNERGIGAAVTASKIAREEIFITSKVWNTDQGYNNTRRAFAESLERLETDYLDLYLIHWPSKAQMADTWRAMEELHASGDIRAIGVSNFLAHHLDQLLAGASVVPAVNQIEHHPLLQQPDLLRACKNNKIAVTAWSPLIHGEISKVETVAAIADDVGASPAQVTLRWMIQRGVTVIPKSARKARIEENADLFNFELSDEQVEQLNALDQGRRSGPNPDNFPGT